MAEFLAVMTSLPRIEEGFADARLGRGLRYENMLRNTARTYIVVER